MEPNYDSLKSTIFIYCSTDGRVRLNVQIANRKQAAAFVSVFGWGLPGLDTV